MNLTDFFGIAHAPARLTARILLSPKYLFRGTDSTNWWPDAYAKARYGAHYKWKPWLLFDLEQLDRMTSIINEANDEEISRLRDSQLEVTRLVAVVAALLAQAALASLSLPKLEATHWAARALLTGSLVLALLSIFFTIIQQRELGMHIRPAQFRIWLSCGEESTGDRLQSSIAAHQLLQCPFELLCVSLTMFIAGLGVYEGSAAMRNVGLNIVDGMPVGNIGVLVPTVVGTVFGCLILGFLTGKKDFETYEQRRRYFSTTTIAPKSSAAEEHWTW